MALMRHYLDYNSTHPLKPRVIEELGRFISFDSNPSSQHRRGKQALKLVHDVEFFLKKFFHIESAKVIFHSGATEFFNTVFNLKPGENFCYSQGDHSAVHVIAKELIERGVNVIRFPVIEESIIDDLKALKGKTWLNYQWMNNETGEVYPLSLAKKIKQESGCYVHVDAVQTVGKIKNFQRLDPELDCYTYSGHKFGSLKGIGFSFLVGGLNFDPLILGGGQQDGVRSGTINSHGILSLKWALERRDFAQEAKELLALKEDVVKIVRKSQSWSYVENESFNTICLMHEREKSDALLVHFDMAGLDVSTGSACTSGSLKPSQTLLAKNIDSKYALQNIRLSFGMENISNRDLILKKLDELIRRL